MLPYFTPNMGSYKAGADLSALQYTFVKAGTNAGEVIAVAAVTDIPIGILMNAPTSGQTADVALPGGGAKLKMGGAVTAGARVSTTAAGLGVAADGATGAVVSAILEPVGTSAASGDVSPVFVTDPIPRKAATVAALTGTMTGTVTGGMVDVTALSTAGGNTYTDAAVNAKITLVNLQLKELQTEINLVLTAVKNAGLMA